MAFKKGVSGNPNGRPKLPGDVIEAKRLNNEGMQRALNKFLQWPIEDLVAYVKDPKSPTLEVIIARILIEAMKKGDQMRLNFLFDRLIGKVKDQVEVTLPKPTVIKRLDGGETILGAEVNDESKKV